MAHYIDAMGKPCPQPVILARQALDRGEAPLTIAVDNSISVENLRRLAASRQIDVALTQQDGRFELAFAHAGHAMDESAAGGQMEPRCYPSGNYAVFIGKDHLGEGDPALGYNLIKMFLYTLSQSEEAPASLLFMNSGVKLPAGGESDVVTSIRAIAEKGTEVLVCGACLNYYGIADKLEAGQVSNMYDILSKMQAAHKVITA